jgi:hypothetical protein
MEMDSSSMKPQLKKMNTDLGWHPAKRIAFRFIFTYLFLYNFPFPVGLGTDPVTDFLAQKYNDLWHGTVTWIGKYILHLSYEISVSNGGGDTTYDYILTLCFLTLAVAVTVIWTFIDRKRTKYENLHQLLRVYVRFSLATSMISYGAVKVIRTQFSDIPLDRLVQPIGDASPMGLLWTFMDASESYTVFTGAIEMICGLLIAIRRTTSLGAICCIGVLINVVMLNLSYDVPVKLYSFHLLVMAIFLIAPDLRRLADLLLFNRKVDPIEFRPFFERKWLHRSVVVVGTVFILLIAGTNLFRSYQVRTTYLNARSPLYGIWSVEEFAVDGEVHPPLITDETRWRRVIFHYPEALAIQLMSGSQQRFTLALDIESKTLAIGKRDDPDWKADFFFEQPNSGLITLEGELDGRSIRAELHRADESRFLLTSRGFHWISEDPFNR